MVIIRGWTLMPRVLTDSTRISATAAALRCYYSDGVIFQRALFTLRRFSSLAFPIRAGKTTSVKCGETDADDDDVRVYTV